jgi:hypothetical protein
LPHWAKKLSGRRLIRAYTKRVRRSIKKGVLGNYEKPAKIILIAIFAGFLAFRLESQ